MEKRRITLIAIFITSLMVSFFLPNVLFADQGDDDLQPSGKIESPIYTSHDKSEFIYDYVPPNVDLQTDWDVVVTVGVVQFLTLLMNLGLDIYLFFVELTIRIVNWVYDPTMLDKLFDLLSAFMPNMINNVWKPLWFLVAVIGIASAAFLWGMGNSNRSFMSIGTIIALVAFVPSVLLTMPTLLSKANSAVTSIGAEIMTKMIDAEMKKVEKQIADQKKKQKAVMDNLNKIVPGSNQSKEGNKATTELDTDLLKNDFERQIKSGIHAIDDSIWKSLVIHPYWISNFGSVDFGRAHYEELLQKGDNEKLRKELIKDDAHGKIDDDGVAKNEQYKIFTTSGFGERFYKASMANSLSFIPLIVILSIAIVVLLWKARAIGRTIFLVFDFLMALYPGYGISSAIQSVVKVFMSFLMVLFYTIALGSFLAFWTKIQDPNVFVGASYGDRIILILLLLFGLWTGVQGVQRRISNIPGLFGGSTQISDGQNDLGLMRRMLAFSAIKGASNLVGKPVGKVMQKTKDNLIKKPAKFMGNLAKKQAMKGVRRTGQYIQNTGAFQSARRRIGFLKPTQAKLQTNLSKGASDVYRGMAKKGLNPKIEKHRQHYLEKNPLQDKNMHELSDWVEQEPHYQLSEFPDLDGSIIPPSPPPKSSPEYMVWQSTPKLQEHWDTYMQACRNVHGEKHKNYRNQMQKYDRSLFRRLLTERPRLEEPAERERENMMEYRKLLNEKKER